MNFIRRLIARFTTVTIGQAIAGLDRAIVNLDRATAFHTKQVEEQTFIAEQATTAAGKHEYAAIRAERIRNKLADLIG